MPCPALPRPESTVDTRRRDKYLREHQTVLGASALELARRADPGPDHHENTVMKHIALAAFISLCTISAYAAAPTCAAQATEKKLAGAAKASFLRKCTGDAVANARQVCETQAADKKLAGAAKVSFTKKCINDSAPDVQATCDLTADDKKLAGAARTSFVTKCVTDSAK